MTEKSFYWDGLSLGDATLAPYDSAEFSQARYGIFGGPVGPQNLSIIPIAQYGNNNLIVTGTATPVTVAAGYALVLGRFYINDAALTVTVPTPAANPRLDRIVIRTTFATQQSRITRIGGTETASPIAPPLVQNATLWDLALAQVYVTTGGVITVRDERPGGMGIGPGVLFRDILGRENEEFFEHFTATDVATPAGWRAVVTGTGALTQITVSPLSSVRLSTGGASVGSATLDRSSRYSHRLSQAPMLFEAYIAFTGSTNAACAMTMGLYSAGAQLSFGYIGAYSLTNLVVLGTTGGSSSFITNQAVDVSGAFHKYGIWIPASGGPVTVLYDGVAIGQLSANLHASGTAIQPLFLCSNGAAAVSELMDIDWTRLVRSTG